MSQAHEGPLAFAHIGDLHLTRAAERNFIDLLSIVVQLEVEFGAALDFVILPGDLPKCETRDEARSRRGNLKRQASRFA